MKIWRVVIVLILILTGAFVAKRQLLGNPHSSQVNPRSTAPVKALISPEAEAPFPIILPGQSCDEVGAKYGRATESDRYHKAWKLDHMKVSVDVPSKGPCVVKSASYEAVTGQTVSTPDGVVLGRETLQTAKAKLQADLTSDSPYIWQGEGQIWVDIIVRPRPNFPYWVSYSWPLEQSKVDKLTREPVVTDFTDESVFSFSVDAQEPPRS